MVCVVFVVTVGLAIVALAAVVVIVVAMLVRRLPPKLDRGGASDLLVFLALAVAIPDKAMEISRFYFGGYVFITYVARDRPPRATAAAARDAGDAMRPIPMPDVRDRPRRAAAAAAFDIRNARLPIPLADIGGTPVDHRPEMGYCTCGEPAKRKSMYRCYSCWVKMTTYEREIAAMEHTRMFPDSADVIVPPSPPSPAANDPPSSDEEPPTSPSFEPEDEFGPSPTAASSGMSMPVPRPRNSKQSRTSTPNDEKNKPAAKKSKTAPRASKTVKPPKKERKK